jgi:hypothetical protein
MKLPKPIIKEFSYNYVPAKVYVNTYIELKWDVRNSFIVFLKVNNPNIQLLKKRIKFFNKIGFRAKKSTLPVWVTGSSSYKITAIGWFGITKDTFTVDVKGLEKNEIKVRRFNKPNSSNLERKQIIEFNTRADIERVQAAKIEFLKQDLDFLKQDFQLINKVSKIEYDISEVNGKLQNIEKLDEFSEVNKIKQDYYGNV